MTSNLKILRVKGNEITPYISELAQLRLRVFREYPYLYEGKLDDEKSYLQTYLQCPESIMVVVLDKDQVVGASTAIPLEFETLSVQKPFFDQGMNIKNIFYLGESVLLSKYRGKKVYRHFFVNREVAARAYGSKMTAFCAVERSPEDPRRPKNFVPLNQVWQHFGYQKHPELFTYFEWKEIGDESKVNNTMVFWLKTL